jgi:REP element-mobilizing transposase RayT
MNHLLKLHGGHVKILSYVIMSNHYHLVLSHNPDRKLPLHETQHRFFNYYSHENFEKVWQEDSYEKVTRRMQNLSMFIGELERRLTNWFNNVYYVQKHRKIRRGHLWQGRFKSVVIDSYVGMRNCVSYVECNPLRAKIVDDPGDYHFSSFGLYKGKGTHPFAENFAEYFLEEEYGNEVTAPDKLNKSLNFLETLLINKLKVQRFLTEKEAYEVMEKNPFEILTRRVKHWKDAKVIFCKLKRSEIKETVHEKVLNARKIIHAYRDSRGNGLRVLNWHKTPPCPDL